MLARRASVLLSKLPGTLLFPFLHIDYDGGFAQFFDQARVLLLEFLIFFLERMALGLRAALLRDRKSVV